MSHGSDETLDIEQPTALASYLRHAGLIHATETPRITVLAGGVSNRTVLVERPNGESWVIKQALAKLRVKVDWFSDPARIAREADGLRWLAEMAPPGTTTPLVFEDTDRYLLGMKAVPPPHDNFKTLLLCGHVEADHVRQFATLLGTVHRHGWERRDEMIRVFGDRSFFESLRVEPYYAYTASQVHEVHDTITRLIDETRSHQYTVVHGDYSPKNILVYQGKLILLDHEVIHFGDPAFDLGFSLAHLLSKAHHMPECASVFARAATTYWMIYRETLGDMPWTDGLEPRVARHTLACLLARVAGRSPLEYMTADERVRQRNVVVRLLNTTWDSLPVMIQAFVNEVHDAGD